MTAYVSRRAGLSELAALFQWCTAKKYRWVYARNKARGSRREGPEGVGFLGCPPPQPTSGSEGAS